MSQTKPETPGLVTIGLPCYNAERYLAQSIESLLAQTFQDFTLIVCDNASTDATGEIARRYADADPRVRYHRNPLNVGMPGNFNRAFELSNSKYFKWSTADDYWHPQMLATAVAILEADPAIGLVHPCVVLVDGEGRELRRYDDQLHLMQEDPADRFCFALDHLQLVHHHLGVLRTETIRRTQLFSKHVAADLGFVAEMSLYGKFWRVPDYHIFRRMHPDSSSWQRGNKDHEARRFHAANVRRTPFNTWRIHAAYWRAARRAPLTLAQQLRIYKRLLKSLYWDQEALTAELREDLRRAEVKPANTPPGKVV